MDKKTIQKMNNTIIAYFATLILLSAGISAYYKHTNSKISWAYTGLALEHTALLGAMVWKKERTK